MLKPISATAASQQHKPSCWWTPRALRKRHTFGPQSVSVSIATFIYIYTHTCMSAGGELIISSSALENDCDREPLLQMRNKSSPIGSIVICARWDRLSRTHAADTANERSRVLIRCERALAELVPSVCMRDECCVRRRSRRRRAG
jgi:hypothetical protein